MLRFVTRPNPRLKQMVLEAKRKLKWEHPIIGMHVIIKITKKIYISNPLIVLIVKTITVALPYLFQSNKTKDLTEKDLLLPGNELVAAGYCM